MKPYRMRSGSYRIRSGLYKRYMGLGMYWVGDVWGWVLLGWYPHLGPYGTGADSPILGCMEPYGARSIWVWDWFLHPRSYGAIWNWDHIGPGLVLPTIRDQGWAGSPIPGHMGALWNWVHTYPGPYGSICASVKRRRGPPKPPEVEPGRPVRTGSAQFVRELRGRTFPR